MKKPLILLLISIILVFSVVLYKDQKDQKERDRETQIQLQKEKELSDQKEVFYKECKSDFPKKTQEVNANIIAEKYKGNFNDKTVMIYSTIGNYPLGFYSYTNHDIQYYSEDEWIQRCIYTKIKILENVSVN